MPGRVRRKYPSLRLQTHDYSAPREYFLTLKVQDCLPVFGRIENGVMILNAYGDHAHKVWQGVPVRFPGVRIDAFVVMPDHFHGIVAIDGVGPQSAKMGSHMDVSERRLMRRRMLIPKIVGYFRMNTAKYVNQDRGTSGRNVWQREYHDHIIRNNVELERIRRYIIDNPMRWWQRYGAGAG